MTSGNGLRSQQQEAERKERLIMDLKMEVTHLRRRLQQRVGGDATAAELEDEAFVLQSDLGKAQAAAKAREAEMQLLTAKHEKAIRDLMRVDEFWQLSKQQTRLAQDAQQAAERRLEHAAQRGEALQEQLQAASDRETTLADRLDALDQEKQQAQHQRDARAAEAQRRELQVHELRAQLEATRQSLETQMKEQEGATREDVRRLQDQLQKAQESAAALRGEVHARQQEAATVDAELRDVKDAEAAVKQRLVKLTEDHAMLRVHLESAKQVAVESTARATQAEMENDSMRRELEERNDVLSDKEQEILALEQELVQKQNSIEEEVARKKQAVGETEQRLTTECQEMLQAQEETWSCREKVLQGQVEAYKQEVACIQAFHVELMHLLQPAENDVKSEQVEYVESTKLQALVEQAVNERETLTTKLEQMKVNFTATKRQLGSQKQLEADNSKLRAKYEKAKQVMERMTTRTQKSLSSVPSLPARSIGHDSSSAGAVAPIVKRKLETGGGIDAVRMTPRKAQRSRHVYVASRYLSSPSKR
ncbi:hypothetical protein PRNP1_010230 [Phytophthora ramorum]